jgi:RHS repeat-associated protein
MPPISSKQEIVTGNPLLYKGCTEANATTGLYDLFFRNYDPVLGRMMQVDPKATAPCDSSLLVV